MDTIIAKRQTAYCPKFGGERTIFLDILKHPSLTQNFFCVRRFDCSEFRTCEHVGGNGECTFLTEVFNRYDARD